MIFDKDVDYNDDSDYFWIDAEDMKGEIITAVSVNSEDREIVFHTAHNQKITMYHEQDCCEDVYLEDVCGDMADIIGLPLTMAEAETSDANEGKDEDDDDYYYDSATWTFYKFGTSQGSVTLRWVGMSNGYYSEEVSLKVETGECYNG